MVREEQNIKRLWFIWISLLYLSFAACDEENLNITEPEKEGTRIVILYTNDEHGWMETNENSGGAAGLMGLWRQQEGYSENGPYLILSGGDMWTGPAISTWFKGESMVDVMNGMQYDAAAIGNHEFDFKIEGLEDRIEESNFPLLSANIREKATGIIPDFAIPYTLKEIDGVMIGLIGLTTTSTPLTTFPTHVADYDFISYNTALNEIVPQAKEDGAELLIIIGHICGNEMQALIPTAVQLGISVIGGGHCNELIGGLEDGITLIEGGSRMESYAKVEIWFDDINNKVNAMIPSVHYNTGGDPDPQVESIVSFWKTQMNVSLSEVIGYANPEIGRRSDEMYNMITDSWLITLQSADVSLTNTGGIRQSIPSGEITLATIVGLLPFENTIVQLELTGQQLVDGIDNLVMGGMTTINGYRLSDGTPIQMDTTYSVLTTDYLYARPDYSFQYNDPDPYQTAIHYRQPVIDWIRSLDTSPGNPLNDYLDYNPRR